MPDAKKVLFLDVDGVLNTRGKHYDTELNPECLKQLKTIVDITGAKVVVISQWRLISGLLNSLADVFKEYGIYNSLLGVTGDIGLHYRAEEVYGFLFRLPIGCTFAVVDDTPNYYETDVYGHITKNLVVTDKYAGLTGVEADKIMKILTE